MNDENQTREKLNLKWMNQIICKLKLKLKSESESEWWWRWLTDNWLCSMCTSAKTKRKKKGWNFTVYRAIIEKLVLSSNQIKMMNCVRVCVCVCFSSYSKVINIIIINIGWLWNWFQIQIVNIGKMNEWMNKFWFRLREWIKNEFRWWWWW